MASSYRAYPRSSTPWHPSKSDQELWIKQSWAGPILERDIKIQNLQAELDACMERSQKSVRLKEKEMMILSRENERLSKELHAAKEAIEVFKMQRQNTLMCIEVAQQELSDTTYDRIKSKLRQVVLGLYHRS
ncbi:hypothetical protein CORC01_07148 [Colletotrichum orchidophilum]|uniref:Uncharacterized protein n=1 Tax=Colletotrichum orchidophilum TaxID=1209926 RepID=A0A1G4B8A7_9PEZI|nr:uncharacterized protein CORC01_07148 [Colletotrichum orchidophilum]OHE97533.1 hypothetical protein CORC01_07148 [Colletotrichum orchidophilum]